MPYKTNQALPDSVKGSLPKAAQDIFRKVFNAALKQYDDEEKAFKVAWSAVKKAGYKKVDDKWIKESVIEDKQKLEEYDETYAEWGITSFEQLEAQEKIIKKAIEIEDLTISFRRMITNVMQSIEIEDKIGGINKLTKEFTSRLNSMQEIAQRKAIKENEENKAEFAESELSPITELSESETGPLHAIVRIIKPGWGNKKHNHYYPKDILQRDAFQFVGAKMYETDHRPNEKSTRTWVSTIEDIVGSDNGAPLAKVAVHNEDFAGRLRNLNELGMLEKMECSILANGLAKSGFKLNGREGKQVEAITNVSSVDWVTRAGAGGAAVSLMENDKLESNKEKDMSELDKKAETEQKEIQPENVEEVEILESEEQIEEKEQEPTLMSVAEIKEVLSKTDLPKYAQTRLAFSGRFISEEEIKEVAEAELEYIKTVTRSGKPFGMSKQTEKKSENIDKFAEANAKKDKIVRDFLQIKNNKEKK